MKINSNQSCQKTSFGQTPVLLIYGIRAPKISLRSGASILFSAALAPKQLLLIPKAGHDNNIVEQYYQVVRIMEES